MWVEGFIVVFMTVPLGVRDIACKATVLEDSWNLLALANYGRSNYEHGAFIVRDASGQLRLRPWEFDRELMTAHYRGPIPSDFVAARQLRIHGEPVHVSAKAFDLLCLLIEKRPRALSKQEICDQLWPDTFVGEASLPVLVREIRAALTERYRDAIRTVHRFGYAFDVPIRDGTLLDGKRIEQSAALRDGAIVTFGAVKMVCNCCDPNLLTESLHG
jgi:DNA-binding winged helix-turn-helix (wHTH) protein